MVWDVSHLRFADYTVSASEGGTELAIMLVQALQSGIRAQPGERDGTPLNRSHAACLARSCSDPDVTACCPYITTSDAVAGLPGLSMAGCVQQQRHRLFDSQASTRSAWLSLSP